MWAGAGLTKLPRSLPPYQTIRTIPTLAAREKVLHHVTLQEEGNEHMVKAILHLGIAETLLGILKVPRRSLLD